MNAPSPPLHPSLPASPSLIFANEWLAAVHKPAGMATHPSPGFGSGPSVMTWLRQTLGCWVYPVHRLDAPVSGVLVMACSPKSAAILSEQFASQTVRKTYFGLTRGWLPEAGVIEKPLRRIDARGESRETQDAVTAFVTHKLWELPIAVRPFSSARYSLVELHPVTGRTHQLRRHLASLSHPLIGDTRYGDSAHNRAFREHFACHHLFLHARRLSLRCPGSGRTLVFTADFPQRWHDLVFARCADNAAFA